MTEATATLTRAAVSCALIASPLDLKGRYSLEVIAEAVAMAQTTVYPVILMDMQMPKVNGLEATRRIRAMPGYRQTSIIAITANAFAEDKVPCFEAGMNDFLTKPFNPNALFAIVLRALDQRDL